MSDGAREDSSRQVLAQQIGRLILVAASIASVGLVALGCWLVFRPAPAMLAHDLSSMEKANVNDDYTWWRARPNVRALHVVGRCWDHPVDFVMSTNEVALRNPPLAPEGTCRRILAVGDSTTFGLGVNDGEAWPAQLQEILKAKGNVPPVEVLNGGACGYTLFQVFRWLDSYGFALKPDVVIVTGGINDMDRWDDKTDIDRALEEAAANGNDLTGSFSDRFLAGQRAKTGGARTSCVSPDDPNTPGSIRICAGQFLDLLGAIQTLCDTHGARLLLVLWPYREQVERRDEKWMYHQPVLLDFAEKSGVPLVNLYYAFAEAGPGLYLDPVHANAAGCKVAATTIGNVVTGLLAPNDGPSAAH